MRLQVIKDGFGNDTGEFVPMNDWEAITQKHHDLKELVETDFTPKRNLSELAGALSRQTGDDMLKYIHESRNDWEERFNKQL